MTDFTDWTHADGYEAHPLWAEQVNLEYGMMRRGADKVRDRVLIAEQKGQMTRTTAVRGVLTEWLPGVALAVRQWAHDVEFQSKGGPKPIALPFIRAMDPYVAALIALRTILDGMGTKRQRIVRLAEQIGLTCEHEERIRAWERQAPELFHMARRELDKDKATSEHRRVININRFNKLLKEGRIHWDGWGGEVQFRVGVELINIVIRATGWFEVQPDPEHVWRRKDRPQLVLVGRPGFSDWLAASQDNVEVNSPEYLPTVVPPARWTLAVKSPAVSDGSLGGGGGQSQANVRGGYHTPYVNTPRLIRFKASQASQRKYAASEYEALHMPAVFDALHTLQDTAWRINKRVLEVALTVWATMGEEPRAGLPVLSERSLPPRTPRMEEDKQRQRDWASAGRKGEPPVRDEQTAAEIAAWKRKASPIIRANVKRMSVTKATSSTILIAQQYEKYDRIYFPHMLDFRGRFYPIPTYLQPQGSDLARGLLTFADTLPVTEENGGAAWLAVHLANVWGKDRDTGIDYDKVSHEDRITWVQERESLWRNIASDPLFFTDWQDADKPFQALAAVFEWVGFLNEGFGYQSRLPVMVDGTCNGIQHLSAILRDEEAGRYVNLLPSDKPQDIYKLVAQRLQEVIERIEAGGGPEGAKASYWLNLCDRDLPRSLTKRQVMVLPYGGTKDSFFGYTREWLDEHDPMAEAPTPEEAAERNGYVTFLTLHMWDAVGDTVKGGMIVMKWLQDTAKSVAVANQPLFWTTPSGFVVRHFYGLLKDKRVEVKLDGHRHLVSRPERTEKLSTKEQTQGIAPNFIHSLDASALVDCIKICRAAGIEDFTAIHDAYGTHAANMTALSQFLREAFVKTHSGDVLGDFRANCQAVLTDWYVTTNNMDPLEASQKADEKLTPLPELGGLDLEEVLDSEYFFA